MSVAARLAKLEAKYKPKLILKFYVNPKPAQLRNCKAHEIIVRLKA